MKKAVFTATLTASLFLATSAGQAHSNFEDQFCVSDSEKAAIEEFVTEKRPGKPLAVAARTLDMVEGKIANGLPETLVVGTPGTPDRFREVWASIEKWGAQTKVGLYVSTNKTHTFSFPSYVPISLPDDPSSNIQDIYADDGKGIHSHIDRTDVKGIYAARLPGSNGFTRTVSFYAGNGDLILGVIASEANGKGEQAAIDGFEETWKVIKAMPRACAAH